jgi:hypothetical protein
MPLLKQEADPGTVLERSRYFLGFGEKEVLLRETFIKGVIDHSNVDKLNRSKFYLFLRRI